MIMKYITKCIRFNFFIFSKMLRARNEPVAFIQLDTWHSFSIWKLREQNSVIALSLTDIFFELIIGFAPVAHTLASGTIRSFVSERFNYRVHELVIFSSSKLVEIMFFYLATITSFLHSFSIKREILIMSRVTYFEMDVR